MASSHFAFSGRIRRRDYFISMARLAVIYVIAINILSVASETSGLRTMGGPLMMSPAMILLVELALIVPALSLFIRRMNDMTAAIRAQFAAARVGLPLAAFAIIGFQAAVLAGFDVQDYADLVDPLRTVVFLAFGIAVLLPPDPGANLYGPDPRGATAPSRPFPMQKPQPAQTYRDLTATIARKPAATTPVNPDGSVITTPVPHADRVHRAPQPVAPATPEAVQRMRKLPEQGRVKPGWFS
jgi:uncharacterized membrane protein YhaH (DUF805 family)